MVIEDRVSFVCTSTFYYNLYRYIISQRAHIFPLPPSYMAPHTHTYPIVSAYDIHKKIEYVYADYRAKVLYNHTNM